MIDAIHTQAGYLDIVNFINNQISNPTTGKHTEIVDEIINWIQSKDYYGFVQELYNGDVYYGVVFVSTVTSKLLYIENGVAIAYNFTLSDVNKLFGFNSEGLSVCYSDLINVYLDDDPNTIYGELQVIKNILWGSDVYFIRLRFNNVVAASGIMQSVLISSQLLTCYNLKIDKTLYDTVYFKSAKNTYVSFHVEVEDGVFQSFVYTNLGRIFQVQDTAYSRRSLRGLSKLGIVFIDF